MTLQRSEYSANVAIAEGVALSKHKQLTVQPKAKRAEINAAKFMLRTVEIVAVIYLLLLIYQGIRGG